jgi:divalent metal cation (Fe/Co/Zn/Cd) transporter
VNITFQSSFLWKEGAQLTMMVATIMVLYGWHAVWEAWLANVKKRNMTRSLLRAGILTVVVVSAWYFIRAHGL